MSERNVWSTSRPNGEPPVGDPLFPVEEHHSLGWKILQVLKTVQARLRFFVLLAAVGGLLLYWDTLKSYYEKWTRPASAQAAADSAVEFWCPMHPSVVRDHPDKCPVCGMPLVPRKKSSGSAETLPAGVVSRVQLTPYRVAQAGIQTTPVEYRTLNKQITAAGFVEFDETKLTRISVRLSGRSRIDKLYVNVTDQSVNKGDPLALLYSPDLDTTMQNLLDARRGNNKELERMTRERLELWGIDAAQIDQVVQTGKPITHITINSPVSGHVLRKYQLEGDYVDEGARLFDVADLSTVWIEAQVFEDELSFLKKDLVAHALTKAYPNKEFTGTLAQIHPHLDADTRTLKVRFDVDNPGHLLRPGMYATVNLLVPASQLAAADARLEERAVGRAAADFAVHSLFSPSGPTGGSGLGALALTAGERTLYGQGKVLSVPESAVIDTGTRKVVYREAGPSLYEGVEVELGPRCGDAYPVFLGLQAGDRVATAGSFLIDAETRLTGGLGSTYFGASGGPNTKERSGAATTQTSADDEADPDVKDALDKLGAEDQRLAREQIFCPITGKRLGSMGVPVEVVLKNHGNRKILACCSFCPKQILADEQGALDRIEQLKVKAKSASSAK